MKKNISSKWEMIVELIFPTALIATMVYSYKPSGVESMFVVIGYFILVELVKLNNK